MRAEATVKSHAVVVGVHLFKFEMYRRTYDSACEHCHTRREAADDENFNSYQEDVYEASCCLDMYMYTYMHELTIVHVTCYSVSLLCFAADAHVANPRRSN